MAKKYFVMLTWALALPLAAQAQGTFNMAQNLAEGYQVVPSVHSDSMGRQQLFLYVELPRGTEGLQLAHSADSTGQAVTIDSLLTPVGQGFLYREQIANPTDTVVGRLSVANKNIQLGYHLYPTEKDPSPLYFTHQGQYYPFGHAPYGHQLVLNSLMGDSLAQVAYYNDELPQAKPPMSMAEPTLPGLAADSTFTAQVGQAVELTYPGLYVFLPVGAGSWQRLYLFVGNEYYPRYARPETLAKPVVYISTSREYTNLIEGTDPKLSLDDFWLGLTEVKARALKQIRVFYDHVYGANQRFTSYKEGWKTDRGMVYLIYGPPNVVTEAKGVQIWGYSASPNLGDLVFRFQHVPTGLNPLGEYVLIRDPDYEQYWYRAVDLWRKGKIDN